MTGGARIWEQNLHPHTTQLNQSLLTIGFVWFILPVVPIDLYNLLCRVLALLVPAALFAAVEPSTSTIASNTTINDEFRKQLLSISRGLAFILLLV